MTRVEKLLTFSVKKGNYLTTTREGNIRIKVTYKENVTNLQEKHPMEKVFRNACLAVIPLLSDFVAENSEKLSLIKTSTCLFKLSNRIF